MTGWGQDGPLAPGRRPRHELHRDHRRPARPRPGHGAGRTSRPTWSATSAAARRTSSSACSPRCSRRALSGRGQVVDAAIVDGTAHLNAMAAAFLAGGTYSEQRAANLLDGGVPFYDVYETADGRHMSVGALEPQFYDAFVDAARHQGRAPDRTTWTGTTSSATLIADTFADADPGRVGRGLRGHRRLRRRRHPAQRGARAPAPRGARHLRRARRRASSRRPRRASRAPRPR